MSSYYIGLSNSFHDSAIAIVCPQGRVVFAEATERPLQYKRAMNIPPDYSPRALELLEEYCDVDCELVVATTWSKYARLAARSSKQEIKKRGQQIVQMFGSFPEMLRSSQSFQQFAASSHLKAMSAVGPGLLYDAGRVEGRQGRSIIRRSYDHHLTHAATAAFTSGLDDAVCAIVDGVGEEGSSACFRYRSGHLTKLQQDSGASSGSLGLFFQWVCDWCGFGYFGGEEWKVMGLAAYGKRDEDLYQLLHQLIHVDGLQIHTCSPMLQLRIFRKLHQIRRRASAPPLLAADIALAGQRVFTDVMVELLENLYNLGHSDKLILGGGCALNSSTNGLILERTRFKHLHVFSAPSDDGNAIGAALLAYFEDHPEALPSCGFSSPYLGSRMDREVVDRLVRYGYPAHIQSFSPDACVKKAAGLLSDGKIIGWIQGRAEFGPRSLGNRSILADPRSPDIKDIINTRVKFREEFRPFAPSVLHEFGDSLFENYQESPYMERTLMFRSSVIAKVPGVVHKDGTGRVQTVKESWNPRFYQLIRAFYESTGVPLLLNTSFNVMGKPISHSVEDVVAVFFTTGIDALFIDNICIEKSRIA
jgi:carbamoyltransferase